MKEPTKSAPPTDDKAALEAQAREAVEKSAAELRKQHVAIEIEPATVFRP